MSDHKHDWVDQYFAFPDSDPDGSYEHDEPYVVQYCSDRECGQRRTKTMSADEIDLVKEFNGL